MTANEVAEMELVKGHLQPASNSAAPVSNVPPANTQKTEFNPDPLSTYTTYSTYLMDSTYAPYSMYNASPLQVPSNAKPHANSPSSTRPSKWSAEEDMLIAELRATGMKWVDISNRLPGRSPISCRLHYQNHLQKKGITDEGRTKELAERELNRNEDKNKPNHYHCPYCQDGAPKYTQKDEMLRQASNASEQIPYFF